MEKYQDVTERFYRVKYNRFTKTLWQVQIIETVVNTELVKVFIKCDYSIHPIVEIVFIK